jgi:transcriptional regulator with XRE-family HTH domain
MTKPTLAKRVRLARHRFDESQSRFAMRLGISQQTLSKLERGGRCHMRSVELLFDYVEIDAREKWRAEVLARKHRA